MHPCSRFCVTTIYIARLPLEVCSWKTKGWCVLKLFCVEIVPFTVQISFSVLEFCPQYDEHCVTWQFRNGECRIGGDVRVGLEIVRVVTLNVFSFRESFNFPFLS